MELKRLVKSSGFLFLALALMACGSAKNAETIDPLYAAKPLPDLSKQKITVEYWGDVGSTTIEPSTFRKISRAFFGWIPVVGNLMELPLDILTVVLPPLPSTSFPELPDDAAWNDPRVLEAISSLRLTDAYMRIVPENERGPDYRPERCWFGVRKCPEVGFDFVDEIRVYLIFRDPKPAVAHSKELSRPEILLARADTKNNYDRQNQVLHFVPTNVNLRPFLANYGDFDVKIIANGKFPRHKVYLDGRLRIEADLNLGGE